MPRISRSISVAASLTSRGSLLTVHRRSQITSLSTQRTWASSVFTSTLSSYTPAHRMATEKLSVNRALWLSSFTEPPKVVDLPIPEATAGTAVVQVLAAPVVPYTKKVHSGELPLLHGLLPLVPNPNAVGRIHAVGSDATSFKPGDLVYADSTVQARDNDTVKIMAGHIAMGPASQKFLRDEWRDGSFQQFQKVPLENVYALNEKRLNDIGYSPHALQSIAHLSVAGGAILEAANVSIGETVVVGPCAGSFGGLAVELALAVGADVIGVGPFEKELKNMKDTLNNPRFTYVVMTGDQEVDTAAILRATPNKLGADVVSDWSPGFLPEPPYLSTMVGTLKNEGRVVLSGGVTGDIRIPYNTMLLKGLKVQGKWMCSRKTIKRLIQMIEQGHLKIGEDGGSKFHVFSLDQHHEAIENAAEQGGWKNYTILTPSQ